MYTCMVFNIAECSLSTFFYAYALQVHDTVQQLVGDDETAPKPVVKRVVPITQEVYSPIVIKVEPFPTVSSSLSPR